MTSIAASSANANAGSVAGVVVFIVLGAAFWLLPVIIAIVRRIPNTGSVIVVDLLLGWTIIGWIVALAMAVRSQPRPQYLYAPPPPATHQPPGR
jgi:hypothetical protein